MSDTPILSSNSMSSVGRAGIAIPISVYSWNWFSIPHIFAGEYAPTAQLTIPHTIEMPRKLPTPALIPVLGLEVTEVLVLFVLLVLLVGEEVLEGELEFVLELLELVGTEVTGVVGVVTEGTSATEMNTTLSKLVPAIVERTVSA